MAIFFSDTFTEVSDTELSLHTPDLGTAWAQVITGTTRTFTVLGATDDCASSISASSGNNEILYLATPLPASADVDVEFEITSLHTGGTSTSGIVGLVARSDGADTYYATGIRSNSGGSIIQLMKFISGVLTEIDTQVTPTVNIGDVIRLECKDAAKKVFLNAAEIMSSADNEITGIGQVGVGGGGSVWTLDTLNVDQKFDNFVATDFPAPPVGGVSNAVKRRLREDD